MEFRKIVALRGPNVWARSPVLEAWVDLGDLKDSASNEIAGFNDRLMAWLPSLIEHHCSEGERGGFLTRLKLGTYLAHILEHVSLDLQNLAGIAKGFGRARQTNEEGVYRVAIKYEDEELARACMHAGREICLAAVFDRPYDIAAEVARLRELADRVCLGPSTRAIVEAARAREIPVRRLNTGSLIQFGHGSMQRRIWAAETDRTGAIAESIAQDKELTKTLLRAVGVPVPEGRPVESAEDAWEAACEIGLPVVVKPRDANHGRGVSINLRSRELIEAAYGCAANEGDGVLVERFGRGAEHRLLVVGNEMVAAARGEPELVIGDGVQTVTQLVDELNRDPRRGGYFGCPLNMVEVGPLALLALEQQGYTPDSVPPAGAKVLIHGNGDLTIDETDEVHPEVAARVVLAAQVVGLDVAGIDLIVEDISRPLEEQGGMIIEVNASPGLQAHVQPQTGKPRPVGEAIIRTMFPAGQNGRIPLIAVSGLEGKAITVPLIAHLLRQTGCKVGMAGQDGIVLDGRSIDSRDATRSAAARSLLLNPMVEAAVCEIAPASIFHEGLGYDRSSVGVVCGLGETDLQGIPLIDSTERQVYVMRTIVDVVLPTGTAVLNAANPHVAGMAEYSRGEVLLYAADEMLPVLAEHRAKGGKAAFVRDGSIVVADGAHEWPLVRLSGIKLPQDLAAAAKSEQILPAIAAAWAAGVPIETLRSGLASFSG